MIYNRGIINAASFMPSTLPGGAIAQGSVFSIYGTGIGPGTAATQPSYPLQTTIGGVSITVSQGSTTVNAIPTDATATYINAIMPSNTPLGKVIVRLKYNGALSNAMPATVASSAFGAFTANVTGIGPGIVQNIASPTSFPINSPTLAAMPGRTVVLWGTGLGPVPSDTALRPIGSLPTTVEVFVGGVSATNIAYSGRTPCCAGLDQINFTVPTNAPQGCWVPVYVRTAGATVSNVVTMAITPDGSSCLPGLTPYSPFITAGSYAAFVGIRSTVHEDIGVTSTVDVLGDYAITPAFSVPSVAYPFHPVFSAPPTGTCTAYSITGDLLRGDTLAGFVPSGASALSVGAGFTVSGAGGMKLLQSMLPPLFYLGSSISSNAFTNTSFLAPGAYTVSAPGGSTIGQLSATVSMQRPVTWTNRDSIVNVNRSQPLTVNWTGAPSAAQIAVIGFGVDIPTNATAVFACLAPAGAASFTIPAAIMSNIPATRPNPLQSKGVIW